VKRRGPTSKTSDRSRRVTPAELRAQLDLATRRVARLKAAALAARADRQELQARFTALTSSTNDAMIMIDEDGVTRFWNLAAERMFGFPAEEIVGKVVSDFIVPPQYYQRHTEGLKRFKATGHGRHFGDTLELSALRRTGEEFPIEISYYSTPLQLSGRWHAVAIIRDITARKRAEMEVERVKSALEQEHREAEEIGASLLRAESTDHRWAACVKVEPCSRAAGDRAGFVSRPVRDGSMNEDWLLVLDASGHGKGAAKFQEVALGGLIALLETGMSMRDALQGVNHVVRQLGTGRFLVGNALRIVREEERAAEPGFRWIEEFNIAQHAVLVLDPDQTVATDWEWARSGRPGASLPMGLFEDGLAGLAPTYRKVRHGSRLAVYTDGITEAEGPGGAFGSDGLRDAFTGSRLLPLAEAHRRIVHAVKCWAAGVPADTPGQLPEPVHLADDMTLALIEVA
jgi:PAS domain S-box-containing protein